MITTTSDCTLFLPDDDVVDPEVSIVIPAVDEELTISDFVAWCQAGLAAANARGENVIVDSSSDRTRERPLAARRVSPQEALVLFAALGLAAVAPVWRPPGALRRRRAGLGRG